MTFNDDIKPEVIDLLQNAAGVAWSDLTLLRYMNICAKLIRSLVGEARLDATTGQPIAYVAAGAGDAILLDDKYAPALIHGVCWHAFQQDFGNKAHPKMANDHKQDFMDLVKIL